MILGIDVSSYLEVLNCGGKFYKDGKIIDPLDEFVKNDVKYMRIRLWDDPYSEKGEPYLGGTCDLDNFLKLAKIAIGKRFEIYLDIHYSDFWVDPSKQYKPKAWNNLTTEELVQKVYEYTKSVLETIKSNGIDLFMIQVGNEITNGMLWPDGRLCDNGENVRTGYDNFASFLKSGFKACSEIYPNAKKMVHLEKSYDNKIYTEVLSELEKRNVEYDVLGASYYPYWHGTKEELFDNLNKCKARFGKELAIAELAYAFSLEDYQASNNGRNNLVIHDEAMTLNAHYPPTKQGQADFTSDFISKAKENGISQIYYWEPLWVPANNTCWASVQGQEYIKETTKETRNEWANQCLFDYKGEMNPAFDKYKV